MSANKIIIATVTTNSLDDEYGRVKISCEDFYQDFGPVLVVGSIPLKKDDLVFVDISNGFANPIVLDRYNKDYNGDALLWESSDGTDWTKAVVNKNKLTIENSDQTKIEIEGKNVKISLPSGGQFSVAGTNLTVDA